MIEKLQELYRRDPAGTLRAMCMVPDLLLPELTIYRMPAGTETGGICPDGAGMALFDGIPDKDALDRALEGGAYAFTFIAALDEEDNVRVQIAGLAVHIVQVQIFTWEDGAPTELPETDKEAFIKQFIEKCLEVYRT